MKRSYLEVIEKVRGKWSPCLRRILQLRLRSFRSCPEPVLSNDRRVAFVMMSFNGLLPGLMP